MSVDDNGATAVSFLDALTHADFDRFDDLVHPEVRAPERFTSQGLTGVDAYKAGLQMLHDASRTSSSRSRTPPPRATPSPCARP